MRALGKLVSVDRDYLSGTYKLIFSVVDLPHNTDEIADKLLDIEAKPHRNKRSLDANAYAWMLVSKIASEMGMDKDEAYEHMIFKYGHIEDPENEAESTVMVRHGIPFKGFFTGSHRYPRFHSSFEDHGVLMDLYIIYRGSSLYDTKEMAQFIDGVVSDAKELGIDTIPRVDLDKIKEKWRMK